MRIGRTRGWLPKPSTGGTRNVPAEASAAAGHASKTTNKEWSGSNSGPFLFQGASAGFEPASTRSRKEENPIKTRGRYDLPLIPTKAYGQADLSITASRKHGIGLPATLGYVHSDGSGRSVSDMPFGQDGTATQVNQENPLEDISEGPNRVYRFGPSNPLTIVRCTFDFVKSNRVAAPADAHPKAGTMAAPSRSHRPAEACHAYATSESCSHCTGTRIRAAAPRTPPP